MIRATFIGADYSMGFRHGRQYSLRSYVGRGQLWVEACCDDRQHCCYSNLESFLANWKLEEAA